MCIKDKKIVDDAIYNIFINIFDDNNDNDREFIVNVLLNAIFVSIG